MLILVYISRAIGIIFLAKTSTQNNPHTPAFYVVHKFGYRYPRHRFTIAHELGHALIHKSENHQYKPVRFRSDSISLDEKKLEQEANQFAAWLLMPEAELLNELNNKDSISEDEIREIAKKFNVSFSAMNYRLSDLGYF